MNRFTRTAAGLAALTLAAVCGVARAEDQHFTVGDLSRPEQAAAFDRHLTQAADALCGSRWDNMGHLNTYRDCAAAVREEAMAQLTPTQRDQYAAITAQHGVRVASLGQ